MSDINKALSVVIMMILSAGFLGVGMLKLIAYPNMVSSFEKWHYPSFLLYVIGIIELCISVMLFYKPWRKFGLYLIFIDMIGAIFTHINNNESSQLYGPCIVLPLAIILLFSELKNP
jgi:uncharacterized membrane protein YphA (DoxX/SURF4 family)